VAESATAVTCGHSRVLPDVPSLRRIAADLACSRASEGFDPLCNDEGAEAEGTEFVVFGDLADEIESVEDGLQPVWLLVAKVYAGTWDAERPPSVPRATQ
jgi:hypothetical protein